MQALRKLVTALGRSSPNFWKTVQAALVQLALTTVIYGSLIVHADDPEKFVGMLNRMPGLMAIGIFFLFGLLTLIVLGEAEIKEDFDIDVWMITQAYMGTLCLQIGIYLIFRARLMPQGVLPPEWILGFSDEILYEIVGLLLFAIGACWYGFALSSQPDRRD